MRCQLKEPSKKAIQTTNKWRNTHCGALRDLLKQNMIFDSGGGIVASLHALVWQAFEQNASIIVNDRSQKNREIPYAVMSSELLFERN
jgi:hypothetical protein